MRKKAESRAVKKLRVLGPPSQMLNEVRLLPEPMAQALREMIVQGASPEFATEEVNKRHEWDGTPAAGTPSSLSATHPVISLPAVQQYCRADLSLQRDRAHYMVNTAEAITSSLSKSGNIEEGDSRFVHAVVMIGLSKINEGDSSLSTKEAIKAREEALNLVLRNRLLELKVKDGQRRNAYLRAQEELSAAKKVFVCEKTRELENQIRRLANRRNLTPEVLEKIQETYGILAQNVASATLGPSAEELQFLPAGGAPDPEQADEPQEYYFQSPEQVAQAMVNRGEQFAKEQDEIAAAEEMPGPDDVQELDS